MIEQLEGQMSIFDLGISCGKTSPEQSQAERQKAVTSKESSRKSQGSQTQMHPMCLCLTKGNGQSQDVSMERWETGALLGEYSIRSFGEQPSTLMEECLIGERHSGVRGSLLSQILTDSAHPKYYLSVKACKGILNRAEKRGKGLPETLKNALENQVNRGSSHPKN